MYATKQEENPHGEKCWEKKIQQRKAKHVYIQKQQKNDAQVHHIAHIQARSIKMASKWSS